MSKQELQVIDVIESAGLEQDTTQTLRQKFLPFWEQAAAWKEKAEGLVVTSADQKHEMQMARQARLALREIRINADKTRKALKEDSIRYGRAVQGVYNVIEYLIKPIEEHLLEQEKFVEIQARKERERLNEERAAELAPYKEFDTGDLQFSETPYGNMSPEAWAKYLQAAKDNKAAHEKAEAERIAREKAEAEERERIRKENERLRAEAEERERQAAEERRKLEEQARKERADAEAKLAAERAERKRLEDEARRKAAIERKAREAEEEARRKAEAAPDNEKLLAFAEQLRAIAVPEVKTKRAGLLAKRAKETLVELAAWIEESI